MGRRDGPAIRGRAIATRIARTIARMLGQLGQMASGATRAEPPTNDMTRPPPLRRALGRPLALADAALNRLVGWRAHPLYHSGAIAVLAFLLMLATGLYLLLFYRI